MQLNIKYFFNMLCVGAHAGYLSYMYVKIPFSTLIQNKYFLFFKLMGLLDSIFLAWYMYLSVCPTFHNFAISVSVVIQINLKLKGWYQSNMEIHNC